MKKRNLLPLIVFVFGAGALIGSFLQVVFGFWPEYDGEYDDEEDDDDLGMFDEELDDELDDQNGHGRQYVELDPMSSHGQTANETASDEVQDVGVSAGET